MTAKCPCTEFEERAALIAEGHRVSREESERLARVQLGLLDKAEQGTLGGSFPRRKSLTQKSGHG